MMCCCVSGELVECNRLRGRGAVQRESGTDYCGRFATRRCPGRRLFCSRRSYSGEKIPCTDVIVLVLVLVTYGVRAVRGAQTGGDDMGGEMEGEEGEAADDTGAESARKEVTGGGVIQYDYSLYKTFWDIQVRPELYLLRTSMWL